jgi:plastocyanin domain-containing protein
MKNTVYILGIAVIVVAIAGFMMFGSGTRIQESIVTGNAINTGSSQAQEVVISEKDYNYYPNEIKVKAGQQVKLKLDNSVTGCLRSFNINDLNVHGVSRSPTQTIDFTPTKKGTFNFACSMGMGYGTIIVE